MLDGKKYIKNVNYKELSFLVIKIVILSARLHQSGSNQMALPVSAGTSAIEND